MASHGFPGVKRAAKSYFEHGSTRNTAHDKEFFHCYVQYLDEAIKKMKGQGGVFHPVGKDSVSE